ncbi:MAG: histidine kinase [Solobacterium sp.]|nr:histidine kinase [Solobacterium sp.]
MTITIQNSSVLFALMLIIVGMVFTVMVDPYISRKYRNIILIIIALSVLLIIQNLLDEYLSAGPAQWFARTTTSICGYTIRPIFLVLFFYILQPEQNHRVPWLLAGINFLIHLSAYFSRLCFWIDHYNHFNRGPLGYTCFIISLVLLIELLIESIRNYRAEGRKEKLIPVFIVVMILFSVYLDTWIYVSVPPVSYLTITIVASSMFYYIWLHLQFVREHEDDLKAQSRIQIMMTQIQPHFLYNTLSTIQSLCRTDPEQAFNVTEKFGTYLRQNLDSLNQTTLIPIQDELEHTRVYTEIEMVRFPRIRIEYDIRDTDFSVPALTIRPLVENAIRHGVRIRPNGLVRVCTQKTEEGHEIIISDNGIGFDVNQLTQSEETHIGIRNVWERIETMCGGTLVVDSQPDQGTTITIRIPDRLPIAKQS